MKKFYLQIPEPCHEDWNRMTTSEKGRYCGSCCKTVVDFTMMSDKEIISYFSREEGRTCGHFANDQLNRVLREPAAPVKKNAWAIMLSFMLPLFAWNKATAQGKVKVDTVQSEIPKVIAYGNVRKVTINDLTQQYIVKGRVTDDQGNLLAGATIMIKGSRTGIISKEDGSFEINVDTSKSRILVFSYVGYEVREYAISAGKNDINAQLPRIHEDFFMGVVVSAKPRKKSVAKKIVDTVVRTIEPSKINVFPNPVIKGGTVTIKLKGISSYECYLIDNQGNIYETAAQEKISKIEARLQIPSSIIPGIYYVTVFDKRSKKKHTEKIVVQ
jgi:hypothetical protein